MRLEYRRERMDKSRSPGSRNMFPAGGAADLQQEKKKREKKDKTEMYTHSSKGLNRVKGYPGKAVPDRGRIRKTLGTGDCFSKRIEQPAATHPASRAF